MNDIEFDQELTRAALPQAVFAVLSHGESHGYAFAELLRQHGFTRIKGGTLYPLLKRLEGQGLVEHIWQHDQAGPGRKQFTLTELGRQGRRAGRGGRPSLQSAQPWLWLMFCSWRVGICELVGPVKLLPGTGLILAGLLAGFLTDYFQPAQRSITRQL